MGKLNLIPRPEWRMILQLFADDISGAVAHRDRRQVIILAEHVARILSKVLKDLGLEIAPPKCNNFIVEGSEEARREINWTADSTNRQRKKE